MEFNLVVDKDRGYWISLLARNPMASVGDPSLQLSSASVLVSYYLLMRRRY